VLKLKRISVPALSARNGKNFNPIGANRKETIMDSSNSPQSSIQFITLDDLFNSFNGDGMWLNSSIKQFVEDEDAILVENAAFLDC